MGKNVKGRVLRWQRESQAANKRGKGVLCTEARMCCMP
jgi:hypothetical protein